MRMGISMGAFIRGFIGKKEIIDALSVVRLENYYKKISIIIYLASGMKYNLKRR